MVKKIEHFSWICHIVQRCASRHRIMTCLDCSSMSNDPFFVVHHFTSSGKTVQNWHDGMQSKQVVMDTRNWFLGILVYIQYIYFLWIKLFQNLILTRLGYYTWSATTYLYKANQAINTHNFQIRWFKTGIYFYEHM